MSTAVLTPPRSAPVQPLKPHRWTIAEYRKLDKSGLFHDKRTMLLDGEIYVMPMPSPPHNASLSLTEEFLRSVIPPGHHLRNQQGFDVGTRNDPGPDLAVVAGAIRDYSQSTPTTAVWIVEIAVSSLTTDTTIKVELYAQAGVPEYWVLDVEGRQVLVYRDPDPRPAGLGANAYRNRQSFGANDYVSPLAAPTARVKVSDLLP